MIYVTWQIDWPEYECNTTQHHVECNGEEIGQLHVVLHQTHQGFIAVATIVHDGGVEVTLEKPKHIHYALENIQSALSRKRSSSLIKYHLTWVTVFSIMHYVWYAVYQGSHKKIKKKKTKVCGVVRGSTHSSSEDLQPPEAHIGRYVGCGVVNELRDGDEAEVDQEGENVEHEQPLEEQEVGEDTGAKLAAYLFHDALPQLQGLPGWPYGVAAPAEGLREQLVTRIAR